ncbi:hypothetical protein BGX27_000304 [Mortierella sp. AM989]|nr:hypothetical protein BGX27_000304 [Mortierella sp. AM989]
MESAPASRTSPVASTVEEQDNSNARTFDSTNHNNSNAHKTKDQGSRPESHSQSRSLFESRGNLDTLAAAALKPLADSPYSEREHTSQLYQQQQPTNHHHLHRREPNHSHPTHSDQSPDGNRAESTRASERNHPSASHDDRSSRFHYREKSQPSDEDSEEDPSLRTRRPPYHSGSHPQAHSEQERRSPYYTAISSRGSFEQDQSTKMMRSGRSVAATLQALYVRNLKTRYVT